MPFNEIISFLDARLTNSACVRTDEKMSSYTSFKIGGRADLLITPSTLDDLTAVVEAAARFHIPLKALGNGTNLLVSDDGVYGLVLDCRKALGAVTFKGRRVSVGAGCTLKTLSEAAASNGLSGTELAVGIPGSVGGALVMNAGAYDFNIGSIVKSVTVLDRDGATVLLDKNDLTFEYRNSSLRESGYVILGAELELARGNRERLFRIMDEELRGRKGKFPLEYPNAGSIFKRPKDGYPGKWIEMAGCKAMQIGGAEVSTKHANFIINKGSASASDVLQLMDKVKNAVWRQFRVTLEQEIVYWDRTGR